MFVPPDLLSIADTEQLANEAGASPSQCPITNPTAWSRDIAFQCQKGSLVVDFLEE
jgi:hypothetical protein